MKLSKDPVTLVIISDFTNKFDACFLDLIKERIQRKANVASRYNVYQLANAGQSCASMGKVARYMWPVRLAITIIIIIITVTIIVLTIVTIIITIIMVIIVITTITIITTLGIVAKKKL